MYEGQFRPYMIIVTFELNPSMFDGGGYILILVGNNHTILEQ
jgi:hypothetical protein